MNYYNKTIEEIYDELKTTEKGLKATEAQSRISVYGENKIEEGRKKSKLKKFLNQFNDMMIIILIIIAIFMFFYGLFYTHEYTDSIVITVVVFLNAIMGFIQEEKAEVTLDGLKKYTTSTSKVKRDGKIIVIDSKNVVPGDILVLEAGEKVPADSRIISETNLMVDESALTGESLPVKKEAKILMGKLQIQEQVNMVFSGSNITNGHAEAIVCKTGMLSELGLVAGSLNTPYEVLTPLQIKIKEISKKITILVFILLIIMFVLGYIKGYKILEIVMLCVALGVAAIPEGLPAVITISLSSGALVLAKKKTVVRQMNAVETLGSTDIICSDKTGTITQNKMHVEEKLILDEKMVNLTCALCNNTIVYGNDFIGDPTETCLVNYLEEKSQKYLQIRDKYPRIMDIPFDSNRKMMSSIHSIDGHIYLLVKGSLENLLLKCNYTIKDNKKIKISKDIKNSILDDEQKLASSALRVIGFAYKELKSIPSNIEEAIKCEDNLVYSGMLGIIDPPRDNVDLAVLKCQKAGIRPIMITGDSLITACAIAKKVGIIKDKSEGILGCQLDQYTDEELTQIIDKYNVYARVSPEHKRRIVAAWQSIGKVVAMTGDGVNDGPAIKDAHVGVGMGITGTEVTKSVADIILLDDSFTTIVDAIEEGRRIFANIRSNVVYSLSSNFAEIFTIIVGMLTGFNILLPIHILFIDLVTDSIPCICLSFEKSEKGIMNKKPRGIDKPIFTPFTNASIIISSIIESIFVLGTFFFIKQYYSISIASSLALLAMIIQEIVYAISCRNLKQFIYKQGIFSNKMMNIGLIVLIIIEMVVFLTPVGTLLGIELVSISLIIKVVLINLLAFILYELIKPLLSKLFVD